LEKQTFLTEGGAQAREPGDSHVESAAQRAFLQLLEPLSDFASDCGLSIGEVNALFRQAAVRRAASRQLEHAHRVNISGIAAMTGISRGEVSELLNLISRSSGKAVTTRQTLTNRILTAWYGDPRFTTAKHRPAELKIFGRGATFESLVRDHGRGIPIRAILDEMLRSGAIEVRGSEVCPKKSVNSPRITAQSIKSFADRASRHLSVALDNLRRPDAAVFIECASRTKLLPRSFPVLRRDFPRKAEELLAELQNALGRMNTGPGISGDVPRLGRLSVAIAYHPIPRKNLKERPKKRRNFRRNA
jgi:hypothetical protein